MMGKTPATGFATFLLATALQQVGAVPYDPYPDSYQPDSYPPAPPGSSSPPMFETSYPSESLPPTPTESYALETPVETSEGPVASTDVMSMPPYGMESSTTSEYVPPETAYPVPEPPAETTTPVTPPTSTEYPPPPPECAVLEKCGIIPGEYDSYGSCCAATPSCSPEDEALYQTFRDQYCGPVGEGVDGVDGTGETDEGEDASSSTGDEGEGSEGEGEGEGDEADDAIDVGPGGEGEGEGDGTSSGGEGVDGSETGSSGTEGTGSSSGGEDATGTPASGGTYPTAGAVSVIMNLGLLAGAMAFVF